MLLFYKFIKEFLHYILLVTANKNVNCKNKFAVSLLISIIRLHVSLCLRDY